MRRFLTLAPGARTKKVAGCAGLIAAAVVTLTACLPVSGGGYISSVKSGAKANVAFNVVCDGTSHLLSGPWNYNDKGAKGVNVAGDMSSTSNDCGGDPGEQTYLSNYTVQGRCAGATCTGYAFISVYDSGKGGNASVKGDCMAIALFDNTSTEWYSNNDSSELLCAGAPGLKPLLGGNLKVG